MENKNLLNETTSGNAVLDYARFKALGLSNDLTDEARIEIERLFEYKDLRTKLENAPDEINSERFGKRRTRKIDVAYNAYNAAKIFNGCIRNKITPVFENDNDWECEILKADVPDYCDNYEFVRLNVRFAGASKIWYVTLGRFLKLYDLGEFHNLRFVNENGRILNHIKNRYFNVKAVELKFVNRRIKELETKYNTLFEEAQRRITEAYNAEQETHEGYESAYEAKPKTDAELVNENKALVHEVKTIWNSTLSKDEQRVALEWISNHIYSIRVYAIKGGRGDARLSNYSTFGSQALREPDLNEDGKLKHSNDSVTGYISFKDIDSAPTEILNKLCSNRRNAKSLFNRNRLNDLNLALFLLSEYNKYGFKSGVRHLNNDINLTDLLTNEF